VRLEWLEIAVGSVLVQLEYDLGCTSLLFLTFLAFPL
jgi:hypothetical protein